MRTLHPYAIAGFVSALAVAHATVLACAATMLLRGPPAARGAIDASLRRTDPTLSLRQGLEADASAPSQRRPRTDRALPIFALLNLAMMTTDAGIAAAYAQFRATRSLLVPLAASELGRIWATAVLVHFVLHYLRIPLRRAVLAAVYVPAAITSVALVTVGRGDLAATGWELGSVLGVDAPSFSAARSFVTLGASIAETCGAAVALAALARTLAGARRESVAFVGMIGLGAAAACDLAARVGVHLAPPMAPLGYAFLVNSLIVTLVIRYTGLRAALEQRARELKDRAQAVARSYADLRAAQDELVRKEQLTAVGELSAVVAHEVRNPLAIISNAVATLRRSGVEPSDRDTLLGILDEETSRLNRLVGDLLRYTRPITPERHLLSVRDLVTRGMALTEGKIGLDVDVVEPEPTEKIWGDPNLLRQVIDNLIDNAIQAMSSGGVLTVTLVNIVHEGAPGVEVQIQDTGEGMDTDVRARALDPFFTTRPSGTGLGLAIVARIVDAHGGVIRIKSKAGTGTAMHVFLPRSAESPPRSRAPSDSSRRLSDPVLPPELARSVSGQR